MAKEQKESDDQPNLAELIPLTEAAEFSGLTTGFLMRLLRNNEIWGMKFGRNWVTTKKAVREYLARDRKRGPKPKNAPKYLLI